MHGCSPRITLGEGRRAQLLASLFFFCVEMDMAELSPFISSTWRVLRCVAKDASGWMQAAASESAGGSWGEGPLPSASLCDSLPFFWLLFAHPSTFPTAFCLFFLYLFKATWVNREQEIACRELLESLRLCTLLPGGPADELCTSGSSSCCSSDVAALPKLSR